MTVQYDKVSSILPLVEELNKQAVTDGVLAYIAGDGKELAKLTGEAEGYKRLFQGIQQMIEAGLAD